MENSDRFDASNYYQKYGYVAPKYLRKYAFDKMIDLDFQNLLQTSIP
jgi:intergrase/recombinase